PKVQGVAIRVGAIRFEEAVESQHKLADQIRSGFLGSCQDGAELGLVGRRKRQQLVTMFVLEVELPLHESECASAFALRKRQWAGRSPSNPCCVATFAEPQRLVPARMRKGSWVKDTPYQLEEGAVAPFESKIAVRETAPVLP